MVAIIITDSSSGGSDSRSGNIIPATGVGSLLMSDGFVSGGFQVLPAAAACCQEVVSAAAVAKAEVVVVVVVVVVVAAAAVLVQWQW